MQVVGFNFTKIAAEKTSGFKKADLNADIQFIDLEKQKIEILKDSDGAKLFFKHSLNYLNNEKKEERLAQVLFEGNITLSLTKEESKEITKTWKNKKLPQNMTISLYNFILKKCASQALNLQDELNLPSHVQIPKLTPPQ